MVHTELQQAKGLNLIEDREFATFTKFSALSLRALVYLPAPIVFLHLFCPCRCGQSY